MLANFLTGNSYRIITTAEGSDFSQVFAITSGGDVVLTRQYKHAVKEVVVAAPGTDWVR